MASSRVRLSARVVANRANGRRGGLATALKHGKEFCIARATKGGEAVRDRYSTALYPYLNSLKKNKKGWPKGTPRKAVVVDPVAAVLGVN